MIVVTGATGFLGGHVVRRLDRAGLPVRALVRGEAPDLAVDRERVELVRGELGDPASLAAALRGAQVVVHLASKAVDRDGSGFEAVNVEGTRALARAAADAGVRRFLYNSTVGVYGHGEHRNAGEQTPLAPDTPFSRSKAAAEGLLGEFDADGAFEAVVLRPRFVYGEGDEAVVPRLMRAARSYPFWVSGGRARLSFLYVGDFAEIVFRAATAEDPVGRPGERVFHATSGEAIRYRDAVTALCRTFGYRPPRLSVPRWLLLGPLLAWERLRGLDPETRPGISSLRVRMVSQDNTFSNARLTARFPDLSLLGFAEGIERSRDAYARFA